MESFRLAQPEPIELPKPVLDLTEPVEVPPAPIIPPDRLTPLIPIPPKRVRPPPPEVKDLKPTAPQIIKGGTGKCNFGGNCRCREFISGSTRPTCYKCFHSRLYHTIREEDIAPPPGGDTKVTLQEQPAPEPNRNPCSVDACECERFVRPHHPQVVNGVQLPEICNNCRHGEMYHVKRKVTEEEKKSGKSGKASGKGKKK